MQRPSRNILLLGASSLLAALGSEQTVLHVGLIQEPYRPPAKREQICPRCQVPHRTGKSFCSANCCRLYREEKRA